MFKHPRATSALTTAVYTSIRPLLSLSIWSAFAAVWANQTVRVTTTTHSSPSMRLVAAPPLTNARQRAAGTFTYSCSLHLSLQNDSVSDDILLPHEYRCWRQANVDLHIELDQDTVTQLAEGEMPAQARHGEDQLDSRVRQLPRAERDDRFERSGRLWLQRLRLGESERSRGSG